jgi:hypothetical protein
MKKLALVSLVFFNTLFALGQSNDMPNRKAATKKLVIDAKNTYTQSVKAGPIITAGTTVNIYPGDTIYLEVTLVGTAIKGMKTVKKNLNPEITLILTFDQHVENSTHKFMTLGIQNPFHKNLYYAASMLVMKSTTWTKVTVNPVLAEKGTYETWPQIIVQMQLSGWQFK